MHFTDEQIMAQIHAALQDKPEEKILAFLCNWCSYAGADLAGISRCEYPSNVRAIRVMCSGRVSKEFILEALRLDAGMIMIGACHLPYDCHYINGNHKMKTRTDALKNMLTKLGMSPERFRVEYISAAEGIRYAEIIKEIAQQRQTLENKIKEENEKLKPVIERMLKTKHNSTST
jgi:heterodisulfide reductase subunit A